MAESSRIQDTFNDKSILVTGATGFLGKVLLEKLLRSCSGIKEIFILLRPNASNTSRLHELCGSSVFGRIKNECPDAMNKLIALPGDITEENLGLSEEDYQKLVSTVSFVFHSAASVRFEDDPRKTLLINLVGVKNIVEVCNRAEKLEAFVHVSTAYSFCNQLVVHEAVFNEKIDPIWLIENLSSLNADYVKTFLKDRPSMYHYSKAAAEKYISDCCKKLPVIIVRPAIITAACKEPFPGWIDNYNGPSGFIALSSKGILKTLLVKKGIPAEWVPVDLVANTLIVSAYAIVQKRFSSSSVPVINCVCPPSNEITWSEMVDLTIPILYKYPSQVIYRPPGGIVTSSIALHKTCQILLHYLPAFLIDLCMVMAFRKPTFIRTYQRIHGVLKCLQLYTTHKFAFSSGNMAALVEDMTIEDAKVFPIDQKNLDWESYLNDYVLGVRKFFLREDDASLPLARQRLRWIQFTWLGVKVLPVGLLLFVLMRNKYKFTC